MFNTITFCSQICYNLYENSETCVYITFEDVPVDKLPEIRPKLQEVLKKILDNKDINMERMESIINRYKLESLSNVENSPHHTVAFMIIGHMLYGNTKEDVRLCQSLLLLIYNVYFAVATKS